jgi:anion-transporting  ArsA/GET3 family ATPase
MSDAIQVTKTKKTSKKKKTVKKEDIPINNILENKMNELNDTIRKFEKLQEEYKIRLMPLIHNPEELIDYSVDRKEEQLSSISNDIVQVNAVISGIHSVLNNLLDNLEI